MILDNQCLLSWSKSVYVRSEIAFLVNRMFDACPHATLIRMYALLRSGFRT